MHSKINNNKTKTYLQGLRLFSRSLPKGAKNILKKNGYNYSEIISKWSSLMNRNIANSAYPKSIKINSGNENATLILSVKRGNEVLVEYSKKEIIDKINTYFGYNFLSGVRLESINSEIKIKKNKQNLDISSEKIKKKIKQIKNQNIQKAFFDLINEIKKT